MTKQQIAQLAASRSVGSCTNPGYTEAQLVKMYLKAPTKAAMIRHLVRCGTITREEVA